MPLVENHKELIALRESIRARITVAPLSVFATFTSILLFMPFLTNMGVSGVRIAVWAIPLMLLMVVRGFISNHIRGRLDTFLPAELIKADSTLRTSSIANQITVGLNIWIIQAPFDTTYTLPLFMTLIMAIWSIGMMANLFSDFRTFMISMPLMIGLNVAFWFLQGGIGISIGFSILLAAALMVMLVRRGSAIFHDSVLMRFEKDKLLKKVESEREKTQVALREAQAANDSKAYFMAAASHDIKQPLYALGMLTDTLLMSDPPKSAVPILESQRDSISQMSEHFDALMDMGRFQGRSFMLNLACIHLSEFAGRINSEIAPLCARKGLSWQLEMEDVVISTDAELLLRLFRNLLTNAVRYTDDGEISCSARRAGDYVEFLITDTGRGIAEQHQKAVFQEFFRLEHDSARSVGSGLGLSIVDSINRALSLDLKMSSSLGVGTRFNFRIARSSES